MLRRGYFTQYGKWWNGNFIEPCYDEIVVEWMKEMQLSRDFPQMGEKHLDKREGM